MMAMNPNDFVKVPLYKHQIEAFWFACRLFGLEEDAAENVAEGGDAHEDFQK